LEPFNSNLYTLDQPQSYVATLGMIYLVVMGTLGYLPLNLKDIAKIIDGKSSRKRKQFDRKYDRKYNRKLARRRGWPTGQRHRGRRALSDPETLRQMLASLDPDNCLLRLVCEAEFVGPHQASSTEEKLVHSLFSGRRSELGSSLWYAALSGRSARRQGAARSPCGQLSPLCREAASGGDASRVTADSSYLQHLLDKLGRSVTAQKTRGQDDVTGSGVIGVTSSEVMTSNSL